MRSPQELIDWYFSKGALPFWVVLIFDCVVFLFSGFVVYWAMYSASNMLGDFLPLLTVLTVYLLVTVLFFRVFKTYSGIIRYSSFNDLIRIAMAMGCSCVVALVIHYPISNAPRSLFSPLSARAIIIIYAVATAFIWLTRILIKAVYDALFLTGSAENAFIYGIKAGGIGLAKSIKGEKPQRFNLKGFISHDSAFSAKGTVLMGEPVFDVDESLPEEIRDRKVKAVLVAPGRIERFREDSLLQDYILSTGAKIYFSQGTVEWDKASIEGPATISEVKIEDLLPRDEIQVDMASVANDINGKRILITGSAGSIGSEIVRQVAACGPAELMLIDSAESPQHDIRLMMAEDFPYIKASVQVVNIVNSDRMESVFKNFRPEYVFHAAAYKHVPMMEDNPSESVRNNVLGTKVLADLSVKYGVKKFVMISTDKAVNPTNVMGCSKRICEIYVQSLNKAEKEGQVEGETQFVTTRFGNVLGSNGSVIPIFEKQIKEGGPVTVTHPDIIRYFMLIPEACKLVLEAGTKGEGGEIFAFDMGKPVKIADLARKMIDLSGAKGVEIKYTGLRNGEKLYEEVLDAKESSKPSFHEKVRIANVREYDFATASKLIDELIAVSREYDDLKTVSAMKRIVPEYVSSNPAYASLN